METTSLHPEVTVENNRVTYRSRIEFTAARESGALLEALRASGEGQVVWDDSAGCEHPELRPILERAVCYSSTEDGKVILELTYWGPLSEAQTVNLRHDSMVPAHLRTLSQTHGPARLI